jgi:hypothetical protein
MKEAHLPLPNKCDTPTKTATITIFNRVSFHLTISSIMISSLQRSFLTVAFVCAFFAAHAQLNITEYFTMSANFKLNLSDTKIEKAIFTTGVMDITWDKEAYSLGITYDPSQTDIVAVLQNILKYSGGDILANGQFTKDSQDADKQRDEYLKED